MFVCPKCGSVKFYTGTVCRSATVVAENGEIKFIPDDGFVEETKMVCLNCKQDYNVNDEQVRHMILHPLKKCVKCGNEFSEEEVDENGVCAICRMKEANPGFANLENADHMTLMRALALAQIENLNLKKQNEKIEQSIARAEEIKTDVEAQQSANESTEESEENTTNAPKRRGRPRKGVVVSEEVETIDLDAEDKDNDVEIQVSEDVAPDLPTEVTDFANAMNAPEE